MDQDQETNQSQSAPEQQPIDDAELKMPEEQFGHVREKTSATSALVPVLIGFLIILLVLLGALVVWGEEIMGMLGPDISTPAPVVETSSETEATTTEEAATTPAETPADLEAELEETTLADFDAELEAIDAELESSGTTTAQ